MVRNKLLGLDNVTFSKTWVGVIFQNAPAGLGVFQYHSHVTIQVFFFFFFLVYCIPGVKW